MEFTASNKLSKRYKGLRWLTAFMFLALLFGMFFSFKSVGQPPIDSLVVGLFVLAALGFGFIFWVFYLIYAKNAKRADTQRVTFETEGVVNANEGWTQTYLYSDIEKLIVARARSGELKGIALQLPKKLVNLATLERQDDLYHALIQKVPNVPIQTKRPFEGWRLVLGIAAGGLTGLGIVFAPKYFFPEQEWLNTFVMFAFNLALGINARWGREMVSGPYRQRRYAPLYFGIAGVLGVGLLFELLWS